MMSIVRALLGSAVIFFTLGAMECDNQEENTLPREKRQKLMNSDETCENNYWKIIGPELQALVLSFVVADRNPMAAIQALKKFKLINKACNTVSQSVDIHRQIAQLAGNERVSIKAFIRAIYAHDREVAEAFAQSRADLLEGICQYMPSQVNANAATWHLDRTPCAAAAECGNSDLCLMLLDQGACINAKDRHGNSPLILAIKNSQISMVNFLINKQAKITAKDQYKLTALMHAVIMGGGDLVNVLVNAGALKCSDQDAHNLLTALLSRNFHYVNNALNQEIDANASDLNGTNALMFACMGGDKLMVELLLRHNALVNARNNYQWTPLMFAAFAGHRNIVDLLIEHGAHTIARTRTGLSALSLAAGAGHLSIVQLLLNHCCQQDLNEALMAAVQNGHQDITDLLISNNAQPQTSNKYKRTPLLLAAANGYTHLVKKFLDYGVHPDHADSVNCTALAYAAQYGYEDIALLLLEYGANADLPDINGHTPLMYATIHGHENIVLLLLNKANLNACNHRNETALSLAVRLKNTSIAQLLARAAAN